MSVAPGATRARIAVGMRLAALAVLAALVGIILACAPSAPPFDRDAAVRETLERSRGQLTEQQAACYVDRVVDEVGRAQLGNDAQPSPSQIDRLTQIRIDCIGVNNLGVIPATGTSRTLAPDETSARKVPRAPGDDAQLDLLYTACQKGDGAACDSLFDSSPPGSEYEEFAVTCGGRTREKRCADVYKNP